MIEVLIAHPTTRVGWREIVVPGDLKLEQIHPLLREGDIWPEVADSPGMFVNPAHIIAVRES